MDFERIPRLEHELPEQRQCRLCRSSYRSKDARHALCETCRVVIGTYEHAVTKELELANIAAACYREPLVQNAREDLTCPACSWYGNQSGIADSSWESRHGRKKRRRYTRKRRQERATYYPKFPPQSARLRGAVAAAPAPAALEGEPGTKGQLPERYRSCQRLHPLQQKDRDARQFR